MMSHSVQTQEHYYAEIKSKENAVERFSVMEGIRQGASTSQREGFTDKEVEVITLYFQSYLDSMEVYPQWGSAGSSSSSMAWISSLNRFATSCAISRSCEKGRRQQRNPA